ncbi:MAG: SpoIIIAH-like family protein [Clostridia bacterium]|nr:SpoIIIAH-like family protein [Clostridia bacterium]
MIIKKRQLLMATLVLALAAAVFVNWYYTRPSVSTAANAESTTQAQAQDAANLGDARYVIATDVTLAQEESTDYFAAARLRRRTAHDEAAETLNDVIKDESADPDAVKAATVKLQALADTLVREGDLENMITAKLDCDCLVILNGEQAEVIVPKGALDAVSVVKIRELCVNHADCTPASVTMTELNN